jgi:uncharacterized membrane protein YgdD (TMEM256/DUF423 family)
MFLKSYYAVMNAFDKIDRKLRKVLRANAAFSLFSSLAFIAIPDLISEATGIPSAFGIRSVAIGLLLFGSSLIFLARSGNRTLPALEGWMIVAGDGLWVFLSIGGLALWGSALSSLGLWLVIDIALVVGVFASLQARFIALRSRALC